MSAGCREQREKINPSADMQAGIKPGLPHPTGDAEMIWNVTKAALATLAVLGIPMALVYVAGAWIESLRGAVL